MTAIRDDAFAQLGDTDLADLRSDGRSPDFTIDEVRDLPAGEDANIARKVSGHVTVPCYLDQPGCPPGAGFPYASPTATAPTRSGSTATLEAEFVCNIPRVAVERRRTPRLYGHGLLGKPTRSTSRQLRRHVAGARLRLLRDRLDRAWPTTDVPQRRPRAPATCRDFPTVRRPRCSRAC